MLKKSADVFILMLYVSIFFHYFAFRILLIWLLLGASDGSCYLIIQADAKVNFYDTIATCNSLNCILPEVRTKAQSQAFLSLLNSQVAWLGFGKAASENE